MPVTRPRSKQEIGDAHVTYHTVHEPCDSDVGSEDFSVGTMPQFRALDFLSENILNLLANHLTQQRQLCDICLYWILHKVTVPDAILYNIWAQRQSQVFLSYFLVAVPLHLETVDQYAHNGSHNNYILRKPWLYDNDYGLLQKEAISGDVSLDDRPYQESKQLTLETFSMQDDLMVIPSSNPESPQITDEERCQLQSILLSSMSNPDTLSDDESILALQGWSLTSDQSEGDDLFLEVPEACSSSLAEPVPCIKELCFHLKKKQVKDPFLNSQGNPVGQSNFFRKDRIFWVDSEAKSVTENPKETFKEDSLSERDIIPEKAKDKVFLELPVGVLTDKRPICHRDIVSPLMECDIPQQSKDTCMEEDFSGLKDLINRATFRSTGSERFFLANLNLEEELPQLDVKSASDSFPLTCVHEVPAVIMMGNSPPPPFPSPFDKPSDVELYSVEWGDARNIVSPDIISTIYSQQWKDEKHFCAVSSLLVKEPAVDDEASASRSSLSLHQELMELLKLTSEAELEPGAGEILLVDLGNLSSQSHQSLNQSLPQIETFLQAKKESEDCAQELDMTPLQIKWKEDDISYPKVSVSALCCQGVGKQRSLSVLATDSTLPNTVSVSAKIAAMVRKSNEDLDQKEAKDDPSPNVNLQEVKENVLNNYWKQNSSDKTDLELHLRSTKQTLQDTEGLMKDGGILTTSSTNSYEMKREAKPPKRKSFLDDQLNDFLFLTGVTSGFERGFKRVKNEWKDSKNIDGTKSQEQICNKDDAASELYKATQATEIENTSVAKEEEPIQGEEPKVKKQKKTKSKTITIKIPDYYQKVLDVIKGTGGTIVRHLRKEGSIPQSASFNSLSVDDIRSRIKEVYEDGRNKAKNDSSNGKLKSLAQLYICLATFEAALYRSLTSAIVGLNGMLQKYKFIIGDSLDGLSQDLSKMQCSLEESHHIHPKMTEMARQISHWFKKKVEKAGEDQDLKILIILKKESTALSESIVVTVSSINGLKAVSLDMGTPASPMVTSKALDSHNVLVVTASQLHQDFLWAQFSLVVEYEFEESPSVWQTICVRQNIRHMGLCIKRKSAEAAIKQETKEACHVDESSGYCLKLLCSTKVTENSKLIHFLESRYNIMVLERNYEKILPSLKPPLAFADIIVDVVTGVVLISSEDVLMLGVEGLTSKVNSLSQQFEVLWLLISVDNENKSVLHSKAFRRIICQLYSAMAQYSKTGSQCEVKILFGSTIQELGEAIHMICKKAEENISRVWHKDDWIKRQCLTAQASKHEVFLMQFPSINAFTAQVLLTAAPLSKLLANHSADVLATMAPWIPIKFLKIFEDYVKKEHNLFMDMRRTLGNKDIISRDSSLHQSELNELAGTSCQLQYGQTKAVQHDRQDRSSHPGGCYHVSGVDVKDEPSDLVGSDCILNNDDLSKGYPDPSRPTFLHPAARPYHQRTALDLFRVNEENPGYNYSIKNVLMMDDSHTKHQNLPMACSTGTAQRLTAADAADTGALRGQYCPQMASKNILPYHSSGHLHNPGIIHPYSGLIHHEHPRIHPNQMTEGYPRAAVLDDHTRFSLPPQLGYDGKFYPQHGPGFQGGTAPRGSKMHATDFSSSLLFQEMGRKQLQPVEGEVAQVLAHGSLQSQHTSGGPENYSTNPSKCRRLSYQKVPGMPDGQTQLTFL